MGIRVGWVVNGRSMVSCADVLGMGGLFLRTPNPLPLGTMLELIFELKPGQARVRAIVRDSVLGKGMGVQFIQMHPADRTRLDQFLLRYPAVETACAREAEAGEATRQESTPAPVATKSAENLHHRSTRRCPFVAPIELTDLDSGARLSARTRELGVGGCYVQVLDPLPEGALVTVRISKDRDLFESHARVIYLHPTRGMGLAFIETAPHQRSLLEGWLAEAVRRLNPPS
jgi:hypothetical protein